MCYPVDVVVKVADIEPGCDEQRRETDWYKFGERITNNRRSKLQQARLSCLAVEHLSNASCVNVSRKRIHKS